jgi:hypothetical protein
VCKYTAIVYGTSGVVKLKAGSAQRCLPWKPSKKGALVPYRLRTTWTTGEVLDVDIEAVLRNIPALTSLLDPQVFSKVHLAQWGHDIEWFDAELGMDNVYAWAKQQAGELLPHGA